MSLSASLQSHYLAVVTLLDQLDRKECDWQCLSVILEGQSSPLASEEFFFLLDRMKLSIEFSGILSKFLMDRDRAGSLWVNPRTYVNLATPFLEILRDK